MHISSKNLEQTKEKNLFQGLNFCPFLHHSGKKLASEKEVIKSIFWSFLLQLFWQSVTKVKRSSSPAAAAAAAASYSSE